MSEILSNVYKIDGQLTVTKAGRAIIEKQIDMNYTASEVLKKYDMALYRKVFNETLNTNEFVDLYEGSNDIHN